MDFSAIPVLPSCYILHTCERDFLMTL
jgi:hypothetical protein